MRQFVCRLAAAAVVLALASAPALAATQTVSGKVIDQGCYMMDKANNAANNHKMPADVTDCAIACAKKGKTVALLSSDGKVYAIAGGLAADNNAKLVGHMGHTVEITGDVMEMDGKMMIHADALKMVSK